VDYKWLHKQSSDQLECLDSLATQVVQLSAENTKLQARVDLAERAEAIREENRVAVMAWHEAAKNAPPPDGWSCVPCHDNGYHGYQGFDLLGPVGSSIRYDLFSRLTSITGDVPDAPLAYFCAMNGIAPRQSELDATQIALGAMRQQFHTVLRCVGITEEECIERLIAGEEIESDYLTKQDFDHLALLNEKLELRQQLEATQANLEKLAITAKALTDELAQRIVNIGDGEYGTPVMLSALVCSKLNPVLRALGDR
jgi:hypothetical protein